jgi:hypothetical protein
MRLGRLLPEERLREPNGDRRSFTRGALHLEATTTDLRAFTHHRHAEVTFGAGGFGVEADPVVLQCENDVVVFLANRDPHVSRLCMLERIHHALTADVVHEQRDRGRQIDVFDVAMEADRGIPTDFVGEGLERLGEPPRPERRSMQISDERSDAIRRLLLRVTDLVELRGDVLRLSFLEKLPGHVDLDRKSEEHLREVVVEVPRDLESFVCPLLGQRIRERPKNLLAILELGVSDFERLRSEEHLTRKQKRSKDRRQSPRIDTVVKDRETQPTET